MLFFTFPDDVNKEVMKYIQSDQEVKHQLIDSDVMDMDPPVKTCGVNTPSLTGMVQAVNSDLTVSNVRWRCVVYGLYTSGQF